MNYKQLLLKYINHVGEYEGSTFLQNHIRGSYSYLPEFTDEEWAELQKLDAIDYKVFVGHSCSCHTKNVGPCDVCKELGCEVWDFNKAAVYTPLEELMIPLESEDTHDIYAWTSVWDGVNKPIFNCTKDKGEFEWALNDPERGIDLDLLWNANVIYFFGEKEER